ncbi:MAG: hypothetical protein ABSG32_13420 [Terriglobia bacterium]|jgi:hypothetical protein
MSNSLILWPRAGAKPTPKAPQIIRDGGFTGYGKPYNAVILSIDRLAAAHNSQKLDGKNPSPNLSP